MPLHVRGPAACRDDVCLLSDLAAHLSARENRSGCVLSLSRVLLLSVSSRLPMSLYTISDFAVQCGLEVSVSYQPLSRIKTRYRRFSQSDTVSPHLAPNVKSSCICFSLLSQARG